ncbi:MAG: DUF1844 domain-containing protein [Deltaproteobacteria bacterium]|nr:DUF1844 domain-containing protein [Deltaproteobacteria bacterium]
MDEKESKFKIIDKRRFDVEGNEKESVYDSANITTESANDLSRESNNFKENPESQQVDNSSTNQSSISQSSDNLSISFGSLVLSLAQQTLIHLGEISGVPGAPVDLEAARNTIDVLDLLKVKTSGNLTPEETELLNNVTASLKLKYVEIMNRFQPKKT